MTSPLPVLPQNGADHVCPACGETLPDPALIAEAARRHMILPAHEEIHMCPRPLLLVAFVTAPGKGR